MDCSLLLSLSFFKDFFFFFFFTFNLLLSNFLLLLLGFYRCIFFYLFFFFYPIFSLSLLSCLPCWGLWVFGILLSQLGFAVWNVIIIITKRMVGRLKDVHVFRGVAVGMSDHFLVEAEVVVAKEWGNRVVGCRREVVKVEELKKTEKKQEYQDKLKEAYDRVKEREAGELEEEWGLMKESLVGMQAMCVEKGLLEVV